MYTNIVNIPDSILFLTSCRLAIKESVLINEDIDSEDKYGLVDFVMNEASDYQIMNIVVNDEFVEEKYSPLDEIDLFDQYKEMVVENIYDFAGVLESKDLKGLLYEIGPVSQEGISTAVPILEFLHETGALQEKSKVSDTVAAMVKKMKERGASAGEITAAIKAKGGRAGRRLAAKPGQAVGAAKKFTTGVKQGTKIGAISNKDVAASQRAGSKVGASTAAGMTKAKKMAATTKGRAKDVAGSAAKKTGADKFATGYKQGKQMGYIKNKDVSKAQRLGSATGAPVGMAKRGATAAKTKVAGAVDQTGKAVKGALITKTGKAGAIALAAAAIYGGVKAYQRFMSQAAKACAGQSGAAKTACMKKYKANAIRRQIAVTQKGMASCGNAKDPAKCRAAIQARIQKLNSKWAKLNV